MESRERFIIDWGRADLSFSELCRRHGISRKTGYKWLSRYEEKGIAGLSNQSRRPHASPYRSPPDIEEAVVNIREEYPVFWGGRKIRPVLANEGWKAEQLPAASTITNILRRHDLLGPGTRGGSPDMQRFERSEPNDLWQMDFKGHFPLTQGRCHPLTVLDDHSRFALGAAGLR